MERKDEIGVTGFVRGKCPLGSGFFQAAIHARHNSGSAAVDGPRNGHWKWIGVIHGGKRRVRVRE